MSTEPLCADCPDREACMTGAPCAFVKRVAAGGAPRPAEPGQCTETRYRCLLDSGHDGECLMPNPRPREEWTEPTAAGEAPPAEDEVCAKPHAGEPDPCEDCGYPGEVCLMAGHGGCYLVEDLDGERIVHNKIVGGHQCPGHGGIDLYGNYLPCDECEAEIPAEVRHWNPCKCPTETPDIPEGALVEVRYQGIWRGTKTWGCTVPGLVEVPGDTQHGIIPANAVVTQVSPESQRVDSGQPDQAAVPLVLCGALHHWSNQTCDLPVHLVGPHRQTAMGFTWEGDHRDPECPCQQRTEPDTELPPINLAPYGPNRPSSLRGGAMPQRVEPDQAVKACTCVTPPGNGPFAPPVHEWTCPQRPDTRPRKHVCCSCVDNIADDRDEAEAQVAALQSAITALDGRLADVKAERDALRKVAHQIERQRDEAEARLDAVRALCDDKYGLDSLKYVFGLGLSNRELHAWVERRLRAVLDGEALGGRAVREPDSLEIRHSADDLDPGGSG